MSGDIDASIELETIDVAVELVGPPGAAGDDGPPGEPGASAAEYRTQRRPAAVNEAVLTIMAAGHGWTKQSTNGTVSDDTTDFAKGVQSLKIASAGNGIADTINVRSAVFSAVDYTNKCIKICYKVDDRTKLNKSAIILYTNGGTTKSFAWTFDHGTDLYPLAQAGQYEEITLSFADATQLNSPDITQITQASLQLSDTGSPVTVHFNGISAFPDGSALTNNGIISICFDDGYGSQDSNARPILDTAGFRASFNIIADLIGTTSRLTLAQLHNFHDVGGHEINCHAFTLVNHNLKFDVLLAEQGEDALVAELTGIKDYLIDNSFGDGADLLVTPNGAYDAPSLAIMQKYFAYIRSIYAHQGQYVETLPPSNPTAIRAISGIGSSGGGISIASVKAYIDKVKANKAWGILTFHDIVSGSASTSTQCSKADFQTIIDYITVSGVDVRTIGDVMRSMDTNQASKAYVDAQVATKPSLSNSVPLAPSPTTPAAGSSSQAARSDHIHPRGEFEAVDHGFLAWSYDPAGATGANTALTNAGVLNLIKLHLPVAQLITNIHAFLVTNGSGLTSGQCGAALYQNGQLLGVSADQSTAWASGATKLLTMPLNGGLGVQAQAGDVYVALWYNGTTGPAFSRDGGTSAIINAGLTAANARFGSANSAITTTPPNSLGTIALASLAMWAAVS